MASEHSTSSSAPVSEHESGPNDSLEYLPPITPQANRQNFEMYMTSLNSTPPNQGVADHFAAERERKVEQVDKFLRYDLKHEKIVDLDKFIKHALHISDLSEREERVLRSIASSQEFDALIEGYCQGVQREENRYAGFVNIANFAIRRMVEEGITKNALGLIAHVNDEGVSGSWTERKPDIVWIMERIAVYGRLGIDPTEVRDAEKLRRDAEKIAQAVIKAPKPRFAWGDFLGWAEFKLVDKVIKRAQKTPEVAEQGSSGAVSKKTKTKSNKAATSNPSTAGSSKAAPQTEPPQPGAKKTKAKAPALLLRNRPATNPISSGRSSGSKRGRSPSADDDFQRPPAKRVALKDEDRVSLIALQCAGYAMEMLNHGAIRTHVIGSLFHDGKMRLLLYTRSRSCRTQPFSFIDDPFKFLVILFGLTNLSLRQWGILDLLTPRYLSEYRYCSECHRLDSGLFKIKDGVRYLTLGEHTFEVKEVIVFPRGLLGRGSWTIILEKVEASGARTRWVLKLSCQAVARAPEWNFLDAVDQFVAENPDEKWILNHLPKVLVKKEIELNAMDFEALLGSDGDPKGIGYESRIMRAIVYEELFPIYNLYVPGLFKKAFTDVVKCHEWLVKHVHILHRDISVGNLMFRMGDDGNVYGVLNDFDLARFVNKSDPSPSSQHRTGTKPFVAIDLLRDSVSRPIRHLVRHDLESFFYVFAWVICRFHQGAEIVSPPLMDWTTGTWEEVRTRKKVYFEPDPEKKVPMPTENYEPLQGLLDDWRETWQIAFHDQQHVALKRASPEMMATYDEETMGGMITYQKLYELFDKYPLDLEDVIGEDTGPDESEV
ncbi:hypothetical protein VNI00_003026 [Paramarasmius palmivorus]|uniref:Fungal-type protein kinase domain-containing protein n=1 Tax=Paramarasmius palmivorus TaxID=297713 RepID=A0AAW0DZR5_9AGAR